MPLDLVRIALQVPEGLWIGEQRGVRNALEIELPVGKYQASAAQQHGVVCADIGAEAARVKSGMSFYSREIQK
eukprot:1157235-Pyramimonas_sp.AAC.1